jgi:hypothetical protein
VLSVVSSISAGKEEVFMALEPEAAQEELEHARRSALDLPEVPRDWSKYRSAWRSPEVRQAVHDGWGAVVAWLRAAGVEMYPDHVDRRTLAWMLRELKRRPPRVVHLPYPDLRPLGPPHRVICLERLARVVEAPLDPDRHRLWATIVLRRLCLVLFELPPEEQIGLAVATAERYLPAFEQRHPHLTQLRAFLARCLTPDPSTEGDIDRWYGDLSEADRAGDPAGSSLVRAVRLAAEAAREGAASWTTSERVLNPQLGEMRIEHRHPAPVSVTSACVLSVHEAIEADYRERDRRHPEALSAVHAGWEAVVAWLGAAEVGQYVEYADRDALARLIRHHKQPVPAVLYPPHPETTDAKP